MKRQRPPVPSSFDRFSIFKRCYPNEVDYKKTDRIFSLNSNELLENDEYSDFCLYINALIRAEEAEEYEKQRAEQEKQRAEQARKKHAEDMIRAKKSGMFESAKIPFLDFYGQSLKNLGVDKEIIFRIFGYSLITFVNRKNLKHSEKNSIMNNIMNQFGYNTEITNQLLKLFNLNDYNDTLPFVPQNSKKEPFAPSAFNGYIQRKAQDNCENFIYGYPFDIMTHFPVFLCHSVFWDFMDIIEDNENSSAIKEYNEFIQIKKSEDISFKFKIDKCVQELVSVFLTENENETKFVEEIVSALKNLFPDEKVKVQIPISTDANEMVKIDAGVLINDFPFILIEAKSMNYSINAVLQGLQYYGRNHKEVQDNFIDNNPCFLLTVDYGILFIYGVATVNHRIVCDCLMTLEFTNYHFGINDFLNVLYRCISSLFYFYSKFSERMHHKDEDSIHKKYVELKNSVTPNNQPFPAIFSVKSWENDHERIEIEFESVPVDENSGVNDSSRSFMGQHKMYKANIKTNVYLVRMVSRGDDLALLKVCFNYGIEAHDILAKNNMAPKIYGYEKFRDNCQVVLMEYLDKKNNNFESVFDYLRNKSAPNYDSVGLFDALEKFLSQVHSKKIVHGDFRSNNIFVRTGTFHVSEIDSKQNEFEYENDNDRNNNSEASTSTSTLTSTSAPNSTSTSISASVFEFKLIDFEYSGIIGQKYPCLAMRNPEIEWHPRFASSEPRDPIHDVFLFTKMKSRSI